MTLREYQSLCVKTEPKYLTRGDEALMGLMGLNSEAGKALDLYKKTLFEGAGEPQKGIVEVLGDIVCNVAIVAHAMDVDLETVLRGNAEKLEGKHVSKEEIV